MKGTALVAGIAVLSFSSSAMADGDHADGHGHDSDSIGKPGLAARVNRTFTVDMTDTMRFTPAGIKVRRNETVRFIVRNAGKIRHEFVLGTENELKEHYEQMKKFPGMEHADPNMLTVAPGNSGQIIWQFTRDGNVAFACLQPGHYDAGMKGVVSVASGGRIATDRHAHKH